MNLGSLRPIWPFAWKYNKYSILSCVIKEAVDIVTKNTEAIYISFDVDVIDSQVAPGTGIETKGGLSYKEISYIIQYMEIILKYRVSM